MTFLFNTRMATRQRAPPIIALMIRKDVGDGEWPNIKRILGEKNNWRGKPTDSTQKTRK